MRLVVEGSRDLQKAYYTVGCRDRASGWFILFIVSAAAGWNVTTVCDEH